MMNDWVYRSEIYDGVDSSQPIQIHQIKDWTHQGKGHVADAGCDDCDDISIKAIKPILLTEEVLLKNGFRITCAFIEFAAYVLNDAGTEIYVLYNTESDTPYFYAEIAGVEVKLEYVHQLQHLLRMCGSSLLADNLEL